MFQDRRKSIQMLTILSLLTALHIILSRFFAFNAWNVRIGFAIIPSAVCALLYGTLPTVALATASDILGFMLQPSGTYFPGFTLSSALCGASLGFFLHDCKKGPLLLRALAAIFINRILITLFVNTLWISILYGSPYRGVLLTRIWQVAILVPFHFFIVMSLGGVKHLHFLKRQLTT